jgi:preprotein translocase subunit SecE
VSTNPIKWTQQSREFLGEVQLEFKKVTWPTQKETVVGTASVLIIVAVVALVLGLFDWVLSLVMRQVLP